MTAGNAKLSKASKRDRLTCRPHNVELKRSTQPSVGEQLSLCQTNGAEFEAGELHTSKKVVPAVPGIRRQF